ncbi:CmcI family methyltransferase [Geminocystis sp. GBBB08]|uniref:CmcI family methyltransferase n=1 Tax=Geminocystis sp. GBBB08 TaxID=2604140 RepID=UPI0027E2AA97|nr:CmcI family methyltransferase [Geminocystis sp. GBBB08]
MIICKRCDRPWGVGNNPKTALWEYLKTYPEFEIDKTIKKDYKFLNEIARTHLSSEFGVQSSELKLTDFDQKSK